jgi:predicted nucleic-acid-binding protein
MPFAAVFWSSGVKAVDTNVIVRLLTGDDPRQCQQAEKLFSRFELFLPESVILETEWVLRFAYGFSSIQIADALRRLLGLPNVHVNDIGKLTKVLAWFEQGLDFADALHLAASDTLTELVTFDSRFVKRARGKSVCRVRLP